MTKPRKSPRPLALRRKEERLRAILKDMKKVLVAFSGGVDSTLLLKTAADTLGQDVYAVIASSATYPAGEIKAARALARRLKVGHEVIHTEEMSNPEFASNPPLRCYHCKAELMRSLRAIADRRGIPFLLDGQNADDTDDFRPGARAAAELGVRSPLKEAGLTKKEIRSLSKRLKLPTWNKPSLACLASRFPYHTPITPGDLERVGRAEEALRRLGLGQLRVRHHGTVARIELDPAGMAKALRPRMRRRIAAAIKKAGYLYVGLDLEGYRTGSLNEALSKAEKQ